jgi:hypothetical protein
MSADDIIKIIIYGALAVVFVMWMYKCIFGV